MMIRRPKVAHEWSTHFTNVKSAADNTYNIHCIDCYLRFVKQQNLSNGIPRNFVQGGGQQIQLRTEDRENGDLGAVAP